MSERDDQKARYRAYTATAREWAAAKTSRIDTIRVPEHPDVHEVEDGAYVEAQIWVPRSAIDPKED